MVKVYRHVARKDHPDFGIRRGQEYWEWKWRGDIRPTKSPTYPTPAQLLPNPVDRELALWREGLPRAQFSDLQDLLDLLAELESVEQEKIDNMPPGLESRTEKFRRRLEQLQKFRVFVESLSPEDDDWEQQLQDAWPVLESMAPPT